MLRRRHTLRRAQCGGYRKKKDALSVSEPNAASLMKRTELEGGMTDKTKIRGRCETTPLHYSPAKLH